MKKSVFLLFLTLSSAVLFAQKSNIYNEKGQLYVDTTLCIPTKYLDDFVLFEKEFLPIIFAGMEYPSICANNDVEGEVIAKVIKLEKNKIAFELQKSTDKFLGKIVLKILNRYKNRIENYYMKKIKSEYYIPFKFEIVNSSYEKDLKEKKTVVIKGLKPASFSAWCGSGNEDK